MSQIVKQNLSFLSRNSIRKVNFLQCLVRPPEAKFLEPNCLAVFREFYKSKNKIHFLGIEAKT